MSVSEVYQDFDRSKIDSFKLLLNFNMEFVYSIIYPNVTADIT